MMEAEAEDTPKEPEQQKVTDAGEVFLLMKKDYRISRNIRSQWFFSNLHKTVQVTPDDQLPESERELEVLSVLPQGWKGEPVDPNTSYRLVHTSKATFLARRYRFVFALDLSPSTSSVDGCRGRVMLEEVFAALENCLSGLTEPYSAPGSGHVFTPQIYVTVIAYTPLISYKTQQVIIQGCLVTQSNLPALLATVRQQFYEVENKIAEGSRVAMQGREGLSGGMFDDIVDPLGGKKAWDAMVTPDVGLVNMLRYGILALQLLPDNTSARIVVITDGVTAMPNMEMMESLLVQLRSSTIACSFLQLGSAYRPSMSMGYVLHNQLLKFLAAATFGAYLEFCPGIGRTAEGMNMYQKALFEWHFQKGLSELPLKAMRGQFRESVPPPIPDPQKPRWMWNEKAMSACPIMRKKHSENTLQVSIFNVLAVRLREGYTIKEVNMTKNDTQIEVKVVLPWKHDVTLEYTASSAWPPKDTKRITQVEVSLEGSYDFLHDITCPMKKPFKSAYRTSVVKRFWQTVHGVSRTDQLLVHIQSFASNPRYYVVPESVRNGVPLFYMSHSSAAPVPSLQHSEMKETGLAEFAAFWQPMVQLDTNVWQRWLHTHRITILLTHDKPLPYHLHIPGPNGRYDTIQCRVSFTEVHKLLSKETSFVLVESYCYVKLLFSNKDKPPTSFFVVRVSSKPPCMVVRLAFLGGTPGHIRNEIVTDIKEKLNTLSKRAHKVDTPKGKSSPSKQGATEKTEQGQAERACLVLQAKPLEKMLIRYEKVPSDYTSLYSASVEAPAAARVGGSTPLITVNKTATTMFGTLSRYLYHQRWVWGVQLGPAAPVTAQDAARILATLTKTRLREGFSFAHCYSGMVSMVAEVHMRDPLRHASDSEGGVFSCFLQYVLFPPHTCTTKDSVTSISTDDDELETTEADGELQIIVECWIEPQCGVVINSPVQQRHLESLEYQDIPQALLPFDSHIISALVTFQHLGAMCGNRCVPSPTTMDVGGSGRTTPTIADYGVTDSNIKHVFFPFDLVELLPHCQKVSMQFQACRQEDDPQDGESQPKGQQANRDLFKLMHDRLTELTHRELPLSEDVSASFTKTLTTETNVSSDHKVEDTIVEDTESTETEVGKAATGSKKKEEDSTTPQTEMKTLAAAILEEQVPEVEWKCYMKSVRAGNVVLTVLPKTYQDVVVFDNYRKKKEEEARLLKEEDGGESPDRHDQETHSVLTEIAEVEEFKSLESVEETTTTSDRDEDDQSKPSTSESDGQSEDTPEAVEGETRQDDAEEKPDEEKEVPDPNPSPVTIPIYIFSCQQSCLLRQLELGVGETTPETVRDHRFDREGFLVRSNSQFSDFWKSRESVRLNADQRVDSRETIDEDFSSGDSFKDFCDQVSDGIQQSFVTAVFQSLQEGVPLDHLDVQAAVENVCEEQLQEIDITEFLGTLCGHLSDFQHLRRQRLDSTIVEDLNETKESIDTVVDVEDKTKFFSLSSLPAGCESTSELHKTIKEKFAQTVGKYFQPVPSSPDLYFYCSPRQNRHSSQQAEDPTQRRLASEDESSIATEEDDNAQSDSEHIRIDSVTDSDIIIDDTMETTEDEDDEEDELRDGRTETLGSISVQSEFGSRESVVLDEATSGSVPPLFLNLTCSLRSGSHRGSMGVTQDSLPTCVKDVSACLDPSVKELDLSDFYVTLDIICLTLPGLTISEDSSEHRPELNRMTSSDTNISSPVGSPQDFQTPRSTEQDFFSDTHMEPLDGLPEAHRKLVLDFVDQVNFLLKDEITAALRLIQPVTIETLEKVAAHVHDSSCRLETGLSVNPLDLPLTIQEDVPLQFVFGSDQSHAKFVEALDDLQLPGYKLEKVWPWYYTALDPNAPQWKRKAENLNDSLPLSSVINSEFIVSPRSSREHSDSVSTSYSGREHSDSFATVVDTKAAKLDTSMAASPMDKPSISPLQETSKEQSSSQVVSPEEQLLGLPLPMDTWECLKVEEEDKDEAAVEKAIDSTELIDQGLEEQEVAVNAKEGDENAGGKTVVEEHPPIQQEVQVSADSPNENKEQQGKNESQSDNKEDSDQREPSSAEETEKVEVHADEISDKTLEDVSSDESEQTKQHTEGSAEPLTDSEPIENLPSEQTTDNSKNDDSPALQSDDSKSVAAAKPEGPVLPNFWLIMKVSTDKVEMFCHARKGNMDDHSTLFETLGDKIRNSCKLVNQKMLLQDLHDTRTCNSLLVAEDDEDIWLKDDYGPGGGQVAGVTAVSAVEDFAEKNKKYLAATMQYMPGYFACDCVCRVHFSIHQRLKTGPARGVSRGQQALRSALSAFSVNNQKNMFVFQERTGAVFYLQLFESMCVSGSHNTLNLPEVGKGEDENSLLSSRTSSLLSLPIRGGAAELEEDIREYQQAVEKDSGVETVPPSQTGSMSSQGQAEESVVLMVHGVQPAGAEIRVDLVQILQHRLDDATLDVIILMLARNPMCRLSPADVLFIQPPSELPTHSLRLAIPAQHSAHIQAVDFYLKQNLLQFLHNPKFSDNVHFQDVDRKSVPQTDQDVFLYNRPQESGGKGLACIILGHVDKEGNYIQPLPAPKVSVDAYKVAMTWSNFKALTETHRLEGGCSSQDCGAILQFNIWERGDIDFKQLAEKLSQALQHALCDVITEYYMLTAPIAELEEDGEEEEMMDEELMEKFQEGDVSPVDGRQMSEESVEEPSSEANLTWKDREVARRKEEDHKSLLWKLQSGSEGVLHTMYMGRVQRWFDFMVGMSSPAVVRDTQAVDSRYAIPILLRELCDLVHLLAKDNTLRVYKHCQEQNYTLLKVPKGPPKSEEVCHAPGLADNYILLARSLKQWRECMDVKYGDLGAEEEKPAPPVSYKGVQKFKAQERKSQEKLPEGAGPVPRQRLMIVEIRDTQITTYQYNWAGDLSVTLRQQLAQLSQWHNARSHLLKSLLVQKLGLFHHHPYQVENAANPFLRYSQDADLLVKCSAPPVKELQARAAQNFRGSVLFHPALRKFDQCLRDVHLRCAMHQAPYASHPNPVFRHGIQAQEARNIEWGDYDTIHKLKSLYLMWQHRSGQVNVPIPDDLIDLMKMQSRLVHYCTTPLLYHPFWLDQENGKVASKATPSDDSWLMDLSSSFLQQYIQYLQSLGFVLVQTRPPSPRRMARMQRHSKYHAPAESGTEKTTTHHLQRTIPGGVLFMELSLHSQFFTVRQFALESHRLGLPVNSHLAVVFTDECDKYKDLKHLHSFSHDFHLRCAALYMSGRQLIFPQCYDLSTFLAGVVNFFSRPPRFSQNHILSDTITEECPKLEASQLFGYTLEHADSYGFKSLVMSGQPGESATSAQPGETTQLQEFALISLSTGATPHPEVANLPMNDFDVSLFVVRNKDPKQTNASVLSLQYYVILTSRRDMFPRLTVDEKIAFRTRAGRVIHRAGRPDDDIPPWLQLLLSESVTARQKITGTIDDTQLHCRRDLLWNRLKFEKTDEERKGRRSESDEKARRESFGNAKLSFDEFQELMSLVVSRALTDMDPSLTTLLSMGTAWYQGLLRVLQSRFPAKSRHFTSPDTHHHYLAVLSNHDDNFILLHMNTQTRFAELSAVFRVENQQSLATNGDGSPASDLQRHLEAVVNAAAFHLWSSLL
ncbi:Hypp9011 [Branchiostoma lanceolatum]|uniref:Hypp9011 protein n=1 Tax=Branchiostoma lanceolatum TaxID=7740 RepID=A0A8J9ZCH3_BRALA|nr:Hypp9011 [Branchiostoma lanceolatum]